MGVNSTHALYNEYTTDWKTCRDIIAGSKAVKAGKTTYLPQHQLESSEYDDYLARALFYNATARTLSGLVGSVFRKAPVVTPGEYPNEQDNYLDNITLTGKSFESFAKDALAELLTTGRLGILVEQPVNGERPYMVAVATEDIINWRYITITGKQKLSLVVIQEAVEVPDEEDPYVVNEVIKYRELLLEDGFYVQRLWSDSDDEMVMEEEFTPTIKGARMDFIPFYGVTSDGVTLTPTMPPLTDLVEVNLSHYRSSADLEHARHWTSLPTPWAVAFSTEATLSIGSSEAWVSDNPDAKCGFLEYTGAGVSALENALKEKEEKMSALGARMLDAPKNVGESAETLTLRMSGEQSSLAGMVSTLDNALTNALRTFVWWHGGNPEDVEVSLNTDFNNKQMEPGMLNELVYAQQAGLLTKETFAYLLQRDEMLPPGKTVEDYLQELELEGVTLSELAASNQIS